VRSPMGKIRAKPHRAHPKKPGKRRRIRYHESDSMPMTQLPHQIEAASSKSLYPKWPGALDSRFTPFPQHPLARSVQIESQRSGGSYWEKRRSRTTRQLWAPLPIFPRRIACPSPEPAVRPAHHACVVAIQGAENGMSAEMALENANLPGLNAGWLKYGVWLRRGWYLTGTIIRIY
jgi:hypothetical protein